MGKTPEKEWMYMCVCVYVYIYFIYIDLATYLIHFAVHLKHTVNQIYSNKNFKKKKERSQYQHYLFIFFFKGTAFECTQLHLYSYVTHLIGEEKTIARVKPPGWFKAASLAAFFLCSLNGLHGKLVLSYRQNF